jgi:glycosyltransferase involved in cell wall biosynthesis
MFADNDIKELLNNLPCKTDIVFTRNLPHHEISKIQAAADATCYVSLFEGFGIPIIESMQCGVPVITSNISSMPEVAADAALLVNPHDMHSIAQGLKTMATNTILKEQLIIKGLQRSKFFNWDLSAINYWKSVEQIF